MMMSDEEQPIASVMHRRLQGSPKK